MRPKVVERLPKTLNKMSLFVPKKAQAVQGMKGLRGYGDFVYRF